MPVTPPRCAAYIQKLCVIQPLTWQDTFIGVKGTDCSAFRNNKSSPTQTSLLNSLNLLTNSKSLSSQKMCRNFLVNNQLDAQFFLSYTFISILYMFRAAMCSSSGESIVSIRRLVYVTLYRRPSSMQVWTFRPNLHTY